MSPELKAEREEFILRAHLGLGQHSKVIAAANESTAPGIRALGLKAQFESTNDESRKQNLIQQLQGMLGDGAETGVQLTAAHVFLAAGMKKEALQCVHLGLTLEHISLSLQIYLQLDRLDLARNQLSLLRQADEDSVLTQLGNVYICLATGSSTAKESLHTLNQLSEQYGPSIFLLNLMACALMQQGLYAEAESRLEQSRQEFGASDADTLCNLIVAYQYQQKPTVDLVQQLKTQHPDHFLAKGLATVEGAFEREAVKYRVTA
jgi:coatomer protein complex subunit epsilon